MGYCCFKDCKQAGQKTNCRFFRFPAKDRERTLKWIERSGNESLLKLSTSSLSKRYVCSAHFDANKVLSTGRLFYNTLPNPYTQTSDTADKDGASTSACVASEASAAASHDTVPPFIIVYETIDFVVDLIDEDVDEDEPMPEDDGDGVEAGPSTLVAERGDVLTNNEPAEESENVEVDPLALETEDPPRVIAPLNSDAASTATTCNDNPSHQRDHSLTEVFHIIETVMDEEALPSSAAQEIPEPWCLIRDLQQNPFSHLSVSERRVVVTVGRPMPKIQLCGLGEIKFGKNQYEEHSWVAGSSILRKIFCWPCLLFSEGAKDFDWTHKGYGGHAELDDDLHRHANSKNHIQNSVKLAMLKNIKRKDSRFGENTAYNETVKKQRDVLQRMIDAVCLLAKTKIPFRSHYETDSSLLHGTYLALINTLSEFDHPLKNHLESKNVNSLTCVRVRNGLTDSITAVLLKKIKLEIKECKFVSIILCQTSVSMSGSHIATALRYVDSNGNPCERFIRYEDIGSGPDFDRGFAVIDQIVEEFEIQSKLVAIFYSGQLIELCGEIQEKYPKVWVINNHSDDFSSDLLNVCASMKECHLYLTTMTSMATFFSSEVIFDKLSFFIKTKYVGYLSPKVRSPEFFRKSVSDFLPQIVAFLEFIIENPKDWPAETLLKAQGYRFFLNDFSNTFILIVFARVFAHTDELSTLLHKQRIDIGQSYMNGCHEKVKKIEKALDAERFLFNLVWEKVKDIRTICNLWPESPPLKKKLIATYSRKQSRLDDPRNGYELLFVKIINCILTHLSDLNAYLQSLQINSLINLPDKGMSPTGFHFLMTKYAERFHETNLKEQLAALYQIKEFKSTHWFELIPQMKVINIQNVMPEVYNLAFLCLSIPGTKPSKEMLFSASNRIKNVNETLGQHHKSKLAQLSIEYNFLCELKKESTFYSEVLDEFAKRESSAEFTYV